MKNSLFRFSIFPLILLLCLTLNCEQKGEKVDVEVDIAAIKEILNQYEVTLNAGDLDGWISLWADDGIRMAPDTPARIGKTQIREAVKPGFDEMNFDISITSIDDAKVYGDLGITYCNYTLAVTPKAGGETIHVMPDGKALTVSERQSDGSWKIVYDCFNSNVPPKVE